MPSSIARCRTNSGSLPVTCRISTVAPRVTLAGSCRAGFWLTMELLAFIQSDLAPMLVAGDVPRLPRAALALDGTAHQIRLESHGESLLLDRMQPLDDALLCIDHLPRP